MEAQPTRPIIFNYTSVPEFVSDMLQWRKGSDSEFSVSRMAKTLPRCSKALISRVSSGERRLTRDRVMDFSTLLKLTRQETQFLDKWIGLERRPPVAAEHMARTGPQSVSTMLKRPQNHLFSDWLNPYVKDALHLRGFKPDPEHLYRLLGGIATIPHIAKSLAFLFREGFFRRKETGETVLNEADVEGTDEIPNQRIRQFHAKALDIAKRGLSLYPIEARRADAYVFAVNEKHLPKLKQILAECMDRIVEFREEHAEDNERLYQVVMHLTPVGGQVETLH